MTGDDIDQLLSMQLEGGDSRIKVVGPSKHTDKLEIKAKQATRSSQHVITRETHEANVFYIDD